MGWIARNRLWQALAVAWTVALTARAPVRAAETPKPGPPAVSKPAAPPADASSVERHSPSAGYPSLGPQGAKNTLVFFTDYQCPVCPRAAREMERLVADFKGDLRVELHHNPLAMHAQALDAATAARAAQRQGKFWPYHEALVEAKRFDRDSLIALAGEVGLDRDRFLRDFEDATLRAEVSAQAKEAQDAGALGTPGFLINGHVEVGWASLAWLEDTIRAHSRPH